MWEVFGSFLKLQECVGKCVEWMSTEVPILSRPGWPAAGAHVMLWPGSAKGIVGYVHVVQPVDV